MDGLHGKYQTMNPSIEKLMFLWNQERRPLTETPIPVCERNIIVSLSAYINIGKNIILMLSTIIEDVSISETSAQRVNFTLVIIHNSMVLEYSVELKLD